MCMWLLPEATNNRIMGMGYPIDCLNLPVQEMIATVYSIFIAKRELCPGFHESGSQFTLMFVR